MCTNFMSLHQLSSLKGPFIHDAAIPVLTVPCYKKEGSFSTSTISFNFPSDLSITE